MANPLFNRMYAMARGNVPSMPAPNPAGNLRAQMFHQLSGGQPAPMQPKTEMPYPGGPIPKTQGMLPQGLMQPTPGQGQLLRPFLPPTALQPQTAQGMMETALAQIRNQVILAHQQAALQRFQKHAMIHANRTMLPGQPKQYEFAPSFKAPNPFSPMGMANRQTPMALKSYGG